jgi:mono/diheme cytochrome c family protein
MMSGRIPVRRTVLCLTAASLGATVLWHASVAVGAEPQNGSDGWQIPRNAASEVNPVTPTPTILAKGHDLFKAKCQRCHGATGVGNGPDADPEQSPGDLTDASRASRNPDGVLFYKIWNGRSKPKMPAFKTDISRDEVWTIVHYIKTLRKP